MCLQKAAGDHHWRRHLLYLEPVRHAKVAPRCAIIRSASVLLTALCTDIALVVGLVESTIRSAYKDMYMRRHELVPPGFALASHVDHLPMA